MSMGLGPGTPQAPGIDRPEFQRPPSHGFIGNVDPTLGQQIFDIPIAEREAIVEPDGMLDDGRREAVTAIGDWFHPANLFGAGCRLKRLMDNARGRIGAARRWLGQDAGMWGINPR